MQNLNCSEVLIKFSVQTSISLNLREEYIEILCIVQKIKN